MHGGCGHDASVEYGGNLLADPRRLRHRHPHLHVLILLLVDGLLWAIHVVPPRHDDDILGLPGDVRQDTLEQGLILVLLPIRLDKPEAALRIHLHTYQ